MNLRRSLLWGGTVVAGTMLLLLLTLLFFPGRDLLGVAQQALAPQGLTLEVESVGRAFPLGVTARRVVISSGQGPLVASDRVTCRIHLLPLLVGQVHWSADADLGSGSLSLAGTVGKRPKVTVASRDLRLERLPMLQTALGGRVQGASSITGTMHGVWPRASGTVTLDAVAVETRDISLGGIRLPDALYRTVRGQFVLDGTTVSLQSFALEGDGIYARLKGTFPLTAPITAAPLDLTFELLPKPEFMERQKEIFLFLSRFMVSPGNFQIPVKGTMGAPSIN
jgi:type II secretion system protein N